MRTVQVKHYEGLADYLENSEHKNFKTFLMNEFFRYMAHMKNHWVTNMTHSAKTKDGKGFNCFHLMVGMIFRYFMEKQKDDESFEICEENLYQEIAEELENGFPL